SYDGARDPEVRIDRVGAGALAQVADAGLEGHRRDVAVARGEIARSVHATVVRALDEYDRATRHRGRDAPCVVVDVHVDVVLPAALVRGDPLPVINGTRVCLAAELVARERLA